jgi:hypothetical protein
MPPRREVIDLTLDSDDEAPRPVAPLAAHLPQQEGHFEQQRDATPEGLDLRGMINPIPGPFDDMPYHAQGGLTHVPLVIADFGYLDEDIQQEAGAAREHRDPIYAPELDNPQQTLTQDDCLARVYEVFPDVCPEHALTLYTQVGADGDYEPLTPAMRLDRIVDQLMADGPYPKRKKDNQHLKRKREEVAVNEYIRWERDDRERLPRFLTGFIRSVLKAEFPTFTQANISEIVNEKTYLFQSYVHLAKLRDTDVNPRRGRPSGMMNVDTIVASSGWPPLEDELAAARKKAQADTQAREIEKVRQRSEDDNLRHSIAKGHTAECQACFDDLPMNRQVHCHGDEPHFTCFSCIQTYIKTEVGDSRCRVLCTAGCGAGFEPAQLNLLADKKLLQKLADLQQEQDIRDANLDDLEECPFCDYKAIMPPIEENFEFNCANPECEKISCRRCKATSHIPFSCEQSAKDKKVHSRHTIEEAMTAALIRSCNKCKKQFIKDFGCNKMTCSSCRNLQCYVCSENVVGYDHFDQTPAGDPRPGGKCPLYDNLEQRHEREVDAAEQAARASVLANNPDVAPEDLEIKVSDAVKKSTEDRIRRAGPEGLGGGLANAPARLAFARLVADGDNHDLAGFMRFRMNRAPARPRDRNRGVAGAADGEINRLRRAAGELRLQQVHDDGLPEELIQHMQEQRLQVQALRLAQAQERLAQAQENARLQEARDEHRADQAAAARPRARPVGGNRRPRIYPGAVLALQQQHLQPQVAELMDDDALWHMHRDRLYVPPPPPRLPQMPQPLPPALAQLDYAQQQPFQRGLVPDGFGIAGQIQRPPVPDYYQVAQNNNPFPGPNVVQQQARLANVARNLHQLELMRQQHDVRQGNVDRNGEFAVIGQPPRRRRMN